MAPIALSQEDLHNRRIVGVNAETVTNVTSTDFPGHYPGEDHAWSLEKFKNNLQIELHYNKPFDCSFSLIGIDASVANAFRRILLAEIPTMAIEQVYVHNNTSVVQDEVLAARLGLVPLTGSQNGMRRMKWFEKPQHGEQPVVNDTNTLVMKLQVECTSNKDAKKDEEDPTKLYNNAHVYASHLEWHPEGRQKKWFPESEGIVRPANPDILLAKMRPGQVIDIEMHCVKGIGADHAKFSPVATASYRLLPTISILKPILGLDARKFARCFPKGVIALEEVTSGEASTRESGYEGMAGEKKAVVRNAFRDTVSRECLRHEEFAGKVKLGRVRDHFIFSIESTGQFESDALFLESVQLLKSKCIDFKRNLQRIIR
ncbi:DNA-directed RNA polymerase core subunit rpc40 [Agyrium rufum]|nr:DNA-directed RNA polymerase core subunit rpc40 [Agyrium rufum]